MYKNIEKGNSKIAQLSLSPHFSSEYNFSYAS